METRITVLKIILFSIVLTITATTLKSQSDIYTDTLWAQDSILTLPTAPLHPSLIKIKRPDGQFLKDPIDYTFILDTLIFLHSDQDFDQPFIVVHQGLSPRLVQPLDRKSTRLNSSHVAISYAVFCLKKKKKTKTRTAYNTSEQAT